MLVHPGRAVSSIQSCQSGAIRLDRRAAADQISVAERAVYPAHRWPYLVFPDGAGGIGRALPGIWPIPSVRNYLLQGVGRVVEQVVPAVGPTFLYVPDLFP